MWETCDIWSENVRKRKTREGLRGLGKMKNWQVAKRKDDTFLVFRFYATRARTSSSSFFYICFFFLLDIAENPVCSQLLDIFASEYFDHRNNPCFFFCPCFSVPLSILTSKLRSSIVVSMPSPEKDFEIGYLIVGYGFVFVWVFVISGLDLGNKESKKENTRKGEKKGRVRNVACVFHARKFGGKSR